MSSKKQKWAVLVFPGSNSDRDLQKAFESSSAVEVKMHWHEEPIEPEAYQVIGLPGGFSFGDYLRAGAIAKISPAIQSLPAAVEAGAHVIGICNGFQILLEARLLPGYLQMNQEPGFISRQEVCRISEEAFPWFTEKDIGRELKLPIAHGFGNYQCGLVDRKEVVAALHYEKNPNGSMESIAGVYRSLGKGSLLGLMPHPERSCYAALGSDEAKIFWTNAVEALS